VAVRRDCDDEEEEDEEEKDEGKEDEEEVEEEEKEEEDVSKKIFHSGKMALSEWTCSVSAGTDTPLADYSTPSVTTTRRVVYRPPIAVSLSLRIQLVSYFKRSLW
jgi:hypothetical protein